MKKGQNTNILTLASVFSVFLAFVAVTALCLFAIDRLNIASLDFTERKTAELPSVVSSQSSLPVHSEIYPVAEEVPSGALFYTKLLQNAPFLDNYYLKLRIVSDPEMDNTVPESGDYEIWHFGDRFKIHWYGMDGLVKKVITCDGVRVQIIDYTKVSTEYHQVSDGYTYEKLTPIPRFDAYSGEPHEVFEYSEREGLCVVACEYPALSLLDTVRFSMKTGVLRSFARYRSGRTALTIDVISTDLDFAFNEYMFDFK